MIEGMRGLGAVIVALGSVWLGLGGCSGGASTCVEGATQSCACAGGASGVQVCTSEGRFGECVCDLPPDAGMPDGPAPVADSGPIATEPWARSYVGGGGHRGRPVGVLRIPSGGLAIVSTEAGLGRVVRLDDQGDVIWGRTYNLAAFLGATIDTSGRIAVVGRSNFWDPGELLVARIDPTDGSLASQIAYGVTGLNVANATVAALEDDALAVVYTSANSGTWLAKIDAAGDFAWARALVDSEWSFFYYPILRPALDGSIAMFNLRTFARFDGATGATLASRRLTEAALCCSGLTATEDGDFVVYVPVDFTLEEVVTMLVKLNPDASIDWARAFRVPSYPYADFAALPVRGGDVVQAADGSFFVATTASPQTGEQPNLALLHFDAAGSFVWGRSYERALVSPFPMPDTFHSGEIISDGNAIELFEDGDILLGGFFEYSSAANDHKHWLLRMAGDGTIDFNDQTAAFLDDVTIASDPTVTVPAGPAPSPGPLTDGPVPMPLTARPTNLTTATFTDVAIETDAP